MPTRPPDPLERFSPPVREWFASAFAAPSPAQRLGWPVIAAGEHALISAPTGSGKTLAAFLWCLDRLSSELAEGREPAGVHTLYLSPLKALSYDVERNLREPLRGIRAAARRLGLPAPAPRVAVRTGDTTPAQRAAMRRTPPHLLITTPESLLILLTSPKSARELLGGVRYVIVDEIHALCGNKRGMSLALALERVTALCGEEPVRIGLSATVRPLEEAARFLGGQRWAGERLTARPVSIVDAGARKELDLAVSAPVPDFAALPGDSVWPEVYPRLLELIRGGRSTLIFVRMRAQAERLSRALNELAGEESASFGGSAMKGELRRSHPGAAEGREDPQFARAHHSALARPLRRELEEQLKRGELRALVSTGTLELGIDMGAIDLVVQLGSPGSVMTGLQRVGRAGHLLDRSSRGRVIALYREDLVECTVLARRMLDGEVEQLQMPTSGLDVLAQHVLSAAASGEWTGAGILRLARQAAPYAGLTRDALDAVLRLLAGRYPAEVARGLSAKLTWERSTDRLAALPGARQLVVTSGGTIPDNGYYGLQLPDGTRLGELEEEFVFERKTGDVISFGSSNWRILEIDAQRVTVSPAPGQPAVIPFWKGGLFGRDPELSEAIGAFRRELFQRAEEPQAAEAWLRASYPVDAQAAANLVRYFGAQRERGLALGTDRQVVVEAWGDDLGDHRVVIHSCFGNRLNAAWALALRRQLRLRLGVDPQVMSDDGAILVRLPGGEAPPPLDLLDWVTPEELEELVLAELANSSMYGTLFRQNAARFLVLGRKGAGKRTPLWLQRLRAKDLQEATAELADFPVRLETYRELLQELLAMPRLRALLERLRAGEVRVVQQRVPGPSPVASGLLQRFIGQYMYEYDEPRAERTLRRLQLDRTLLDQLLGRDDLSELLLPEAREELERQWQGRGERSRARDAEELFALVLRLVTLPERELAARCAVDPAPLVASLVEDGRLARFEPRAGEAWVCASEDLGLLTAAHAPRVARGARGGAQPAPRLAPLAAREEVLARVVDSLGPVTWDELAAQTGFPREELGPAVDALLQGGRLLRGRFRADADEALCTRHNLEQLRRRSLTLARRRVEPVSPAALQQLVLGLHGVVGSETPASPARLLEALEQLALWPLPAEALERDLLPARVPGYRPAWLDELIASGEVAWTGRQGQRVCLLPAGLGEAALLAPPAPLPLGEEALAVEAALRERAASFLSELAAALPGSLGAVQRGLWELVWAGRASNDRFEALRRGLLASFEPPAPPSARPQGGRPRLGLRARAALTAAATPWSGRWSLLPAAPAELDGRARVELLLGRHGLLARELLALEEAARWSELYPLLKQLELAGELGRGVFVRGLAAAQFAPSETVDRLRALAAHPSPPTLINACDPALLAPALGLPLPPGATLPRRPSSYAVLERGEVVLAAERLGRALFLREAEPPRQRSWLACLAALLERGHRAVRVEQVNGAPALRSPLRPLLEDLGYRPDGRGLERRRFG